MKIVHIQYPFAITDEGDRIHISEISGNATKGAGIELTDKGYKITASVDEVCEVWPSQ